MFGIHPSSCCTHHGSFANCMHLYFIHHLSAHAMTNKKRKLSKHDDAAQLQEVKILRSLNPNSSKKSRQGEDELQAHDNGIINIVDFYPSPDTYHIVMELARGGDVFDRLAKRKVGMVWLAYYYPFVTSSQTFPNPYIMLPNFAFIPYRCTPRRTRATLRAGCSRASSSCTSGASLTVTSSRRTSSSWTSTPTRSSSSRTLASRSSST